MDQMERERLSKLSSDALRYWSEGKFDKARKNWRVLSNCNDSSLRNDALLFLAQQYIDGIGVRRDYQIALTMLEKVVPDELNELLRSKKDISLGKAYYLIACISQHESLEGAYDAEKRIRMLQNSAACGNPDASYELSIYYGHVCSANGKSRLAWRYLRAAARDGHERAKQDIQKIRENGKLGLLWLLVGRFVRRFDG